MGLAMELLTGSATAPGATLTAATMFSPDSLTVRNAAFTDKIMLLAAWGFNNAAGISRVRSPRLHDNVQGLRFRVIATDPTPELFGEFAQPLIPQDTLVEEISGSAVAGQIELFCILLYYMNLPGIAARFITPALLQQKGKNVLTVETQHTAGITAAYGGGLALNANFDLLKANTDYALLGYQTDVRVGAISWRGADTGNLRVAGPGITTPKHLTSRWFLYLAELTGLAVIPVFNSANKANITVDIANGQAAASPNVNSILVELAQ